MTAPIIESRLDNDLYAFTMGQLAWKHFRDVRVRYQLINRTGTPLGRYIDPRRLAAEIERIRTARLTPTETSYLKGKGLLDPDYIKWLGRVVLPKVEFSIRGDELHLEYEGAWAAVILFETPLMAVIEQLVMEGRIREAGYTLEEAWAEADRRLSEKIAYLREHRELKFMLFGTRRRMSRAWEEHLHRRLLTEAPWAVLGTANVDLARRFGIKDMGTQAHQLYMVTTALQDAAGAPDPIGAAQNQVLDLWEKEFGLYNDGELLLMLPDTFGTPAFLARLAPDRARRWRGFRQDSGDPLEIGRLYRDYWKRAGIDPATKVAAFTDGLDLEKAEGLRREFKDFGRTPPGIGTFFSNDTVVPPAPIVIKPITANGYHTVKLSDNRAKATGHRPTIARIERVAGYASTFSEMPIR